MLGQVKRLAGKNYKAASQDTIRSGLVNLR